MSKVIIITGASSGIGRALALESAKRGYSVIISARGEEKLLAVEKECIALGATVLAVKSDVSKDGDCKELVALATAKFKKIDVLINNAGISMRSALIDTDASVIKKVMDINFNGTLYCTKYALPELLKSKGSVVGVSSIAGYKGLPGRTGYSASKFAMHGFLEALRIENLKKGLHVLIACPGFTASNIRNTALTANGSQQGESPRTEQKMMQPEEVATRILDGIDNRKNKLVMTVNGKLTVFLNKFFPSLVDNLVYNHMSKEPDSPF
jgi:short-subunit dehydrogenase